MCQSDKRNSIVLAARPDVVAIGLLAASCGGDAVRPLLLGPSAVCVPSALLWETRVRTYTGQRTSSHLPPKKQVPSRTNRTFFTFLEGRCVRRSPDRFWPRIL